MTAPSLWECLAAAGVPPEHRSAASLACIRFIEEHTTELRSEARKYEAERFPLVPVPDWPDGAA